MNVAATAPAANSGNPALSPTPRTTLNRGRKRAVTDRERLLEFLAEALVAHIGVVAEAVAREGGSMHPVVLPAAYAVDPAGPDAGGTLYLHGSVAAGWIDRALARDVCVTVTELDGLVAGRSAFHHSMNYRSAVILGRARRVEDPEERQRALDAIVDHMIPGRSATLRPTTRKELAATAVLALPLAEASMKARDGGPGDEPEDVATGAWGGHIPVRRVAGEPVPDSDAASLSTSAGLATPADVVERAAGFR